MTRGTALIERFRSADQQLSHHQEQVAFYAAERRDALRELLTVYNQSEIAKAVGLSQQRISQLAHGMETDAT